MQAGKVFIITDDAEFGSDRTTDPEIPLSLLRENSIGERVVATGLVESSVFYGDYFEVEFSDGSARWVKPGNVIEAEEQPAFEVVENSDEEFEVEVVDALTTTMQLAAYNEDAALFSIPGVSTLDAVILDGEAFRALGMPEYINVAITPGCAECAEECQQATLEAVA